MLQPPTDSRIKQNESTGFFLIGIHSKQGWTPLLVGMQLQEKEAQKY